MDESGEDAEAIGEGFHRVAEEVEHLDLAAGESAFFHACELGEVEVAFVAEFVSGHAHGPDGGNEQVVAHRLEDEDEAPAGLEHTQDFASETFRVVCEVMQCGLTPHKIEGCILIGAEIESIAGDKGEPGKGLEMSFDLRARCGIEVESDDLGLWKDLGQGDGELAEAAANLECAAAIEVDAAKLAVACEKERLVGSRESANRRQHRFRPWGEGGRWMGEVHGGAWVKAEMLKI